MTFEKRTSTPKLQDETWTALDRDDDGDDFAILRGPHHGPPWDFVVEHGMCPDDAKLASAAPEMAKFMLEHEHLSNIYESACGQCEAFPEQSHKPDCEWLRIMKKAGLR